MGTLAENLQEIVDIKENIRLAINSKGVTVTTDDRFNVYPDKIRQIKLYIPFEDIGYSKTDESLANNYIDSEIIIEGSNFNIDNYAQNFLIDENWVMSRLFFPGIKESVNNPQNYDWFATNKALLMTPYLDFDKWNTNTDVNGDFIPYPGIGAAGICYACTNLEYFGGAKRLLPEPGVSQQRMRTLIVGEGNLSSSQITAIERIRNSGYGYMFYKCENLKSIGEIGIPDYVKNNEDGYYIDYAFTNCEKLNEIESWLSNIPVCSLLNTFQNCYNLKSIPIIKFGNTNNTQPFNDYTFENCYALENFAGFENLNLYDKIYHDIDFTDSKLLTRESCINIFNTVPICPFNWQEKSYAWRVTLSQESYERLSSDDISILTSKGWRLMVDGTYVTQ